MPYDESALVNPALPRKEWERYVLDLLEASSGGGGGSGAPITDGDAVYGIPMRNPANHAQRAIRVQSIDTNANPPTLKGTLWTSLAGVSIVAPAWAASAEPDQLGGISIGRWQAIFNPSGFERVNRAELYADGVSIGALWTDVNGVGIAAPGWASNLNNTRPGVPIGYSQKTFSLSGGATSWSASGTNVGDVIRFVSAGGGSSDFEIGAGAAADDTDVANLLGSFLGAGYSVTPGNQTAPAWAITITKLDGIPVPGPRYENSLTHDQAIVSYWQTNSGNSTTIEVPYTGGSFLIEEGARKVTIIDLSPSISTSFGFEVWIDPNVGGTWQPELPNSDHRTKTWEWGGNPGDRLPEIAVRVTLPGQRVGIAVEAEGPARTITAF